MSTARLQRRLWWLTRNQYGRRVYEFLADHGIRASKMQRYVRETARTAERADSVVEAPAGIELSVRSASDLDATVRAAFAEPAPEDTVLTATADGTVVGSLFLSHDRPVHVDVLETALEFDGAYIWRVFVDSAYRQRGIASALVEQAIQTAGELGAERAVALVAVDNYPSKQVFEGNGFEADGQVGFYRLFGLTRRTESRPTRR